MGEIHHSFPVFYKDRSDHVWVNHLIDRAQAVESHAMAIVDREICRKIKWFAVITAEITDLARVFRNGETNTLSQISKDLDPGSVIPSLVKGAVDLSPERSPIGEPERVLEEMQRSGLTPQHFRNRNFGVRELILQSSIGEIAKEILEYELPIE